MMFPKWTLTIWILSLSMAAAVDLYTTGFENFPAGPDAIAGAPASGTSPAVPATDGWVGTHAGQDRSGILAEADHAIPGIGNAGYIGGNTDPITGSTIFVRKLLNYTPWSPPAVQNEVVTVRLLVGIKDSSGLVITRDNFEVVLFNNNTLSGGSGSFPLAGIQFDNSQINTSTQKPWQRVYRYGYDTSTQSLRYVNTGATFVYDTLQQLEMRINYRTNLWSASLDGVPLFSDLVFYAGPHSRNLGSVLVRCQVTSTLLPGSNYMLFDDLAVSADPVPEVSAPDVTLLPGTGARLRWLQEAGYRYAMQWSDGTSGWQTVSGGTAAVASETGYTGTLTDAAALGQPRRFYQMIRTDP